MQRGEPARDLRRQAGRRGKLGARLCDGGERVARVSRSQRIAQRLTRRGTGGPQRRRVRRIHGRLNRAESGGQCRRCRGRQLAQNVGEPGVELPARVGKLGEALDDITRHVQRGLDRLQQPAHAADHLIERRRHGARRQRAEQAVANLIEALRHRREQLIGAEALKFRQQRVVGVGERRQQGRDVERVGNAPAQAVELAVGGIEQRGGIELVERRHQLRIGFFERVAEQRARREAGELLGDQRRQRAHLLQHRHRPLLHQLPHVADQRRGDRIERGRQHRHRRVDQVRHWRRQIAVVNRIEGGFHLADGCDHEVRHRREGQLVERADEIVQLLERRQQRFERRALQRALNGGDGILDRLAQLLWIEAIDRAGHRADGAAEGVGGRLQGLIDALLDGGTGIRNGLFDLLPQTGQIEPLQRLTRLRELRPRRRGELHDLRVEPGDGRLCLTHHLRQRRRDLADVDEAEQLLQRLLHAAEQVGERREAVVGQRHRQLRQRRAEIGPAGGR